MATPTIQPTFSCDAENSRGEAVRDEPAQYISMWAPETTAVGPNGSHYRDSQYVYMNHGRPLIGTSTISCEAAAITTRSAKFFARFSKRQEVIL